MGVLVVLGVEQAAVYFPGLVFDVAGDIAASDIGICKRLEIRRHITNHIRQTKPDINIVRLHPGILAKGLSKLAESSAKDGIEKLAPETYPDDGDIVSQDRHDVEQELVKVFHKGPLCDHERRSRYHDARHLFHGNLYELFMGPHHTVPNALESLDNIHQILEIHGLALIHCVVNDQDHLYICNIIG